MLDITSSIRAWVRSWKIDPENLQIGLELKEASLRALMLTTAAIGVVVYAVSNMSALWIVVPRLSVVLLVLAVATAGGLALLSRSVKAARLVWLGGVALTILVALLLFPNPRVLLLFYLLPVLVLMTTFDLGWGIVAIAGSAALLFGLSSLSGYAVIAPLDIFMTLLTQALGVALTWTFGHAMINAAEWAIANYRQGRSELEDLRGQRVVWQQTREDYELMTRELARLTERLEAMTQTAEEARRVKEEFVANVSHELRTPLNMILGFSEVIMRSPQVYGDCIPPALLADIAAIERNSQHLSRLVDDVLDLSQIEAGRMALNKDWVSIPEIVEQAISTVRFLYDTKKLYLRQDLPESIPPIFCDGTRVRQVLINLLSNAGRFTEQGGVVVRASLSEDQLILSVADTGSGISPENQDKIFEPFRQLHSTLQGHKGGSGLGLSICKQFVEMHDGKMWLESHLGEGTTFYFDLPLKVHITEDPAIAARRWFNPFYQYEPRSRPSRATPPEVKARYVLLEQEDTLQKYLRRYLEGVEIVAVKTVQDAITELRRSPANALIHNMPMAGWEPLEHFVGELPFGTPMITCWVPGREEAARRLGVVEYLVKPVSREDLMAAVSKVDHKQVKRILLVDDEPEILTLYARILATELPEARVLQAMNGQRALHLMHARRPDVILLDLMMPGKDGFQVLVEKSQDEAVRDIPVVVVSSRNPSGETVVSDTVSVARSSGLSLHELIDFIQHTSQILTPAKRPAAPKPSEMPRA